MQVTDSAGTYTWRGHLTIAEAVAAPTSVPGATNLDQTLYVLSSNPDPDNPDIGFSLTLPPDPAFPAASEQEMIQFTFTADRTPIQKGEVSFRIPSDWTTPTVKADDPGEVSIIIDQDGDIDDTPRTK